MKLTEQQIKKIKPMLTKLVNEVKQELTEATFRSVKVTYSNGLSITTDMNPKLSDAEIKDYFKIGKTANIGNGERDKVVKITNVEITLYFHNLFIIDKI